MISFKKWLLVSGVFAFYGVTVSDVQAHTGHNFSGFYAGVNGGYGFGSSKINGFGKGPVMSTVTKTADAGVKGFLGGLHAGYGHQFHNQFYLGVDLWGDYSNMYGTQEQGGGNDVTALAFKNYRQKQHRKNGLGAALHVGGIVGQVLLYVKGGLETAHWKFDVLAQDSSDGTGGGIDLFGGTKTGFKSQRLWGWVAGFGAETMLTQHVRLGGEWTYKRYRKSSPLKISYTSTTTGNTESIDTGFRPSVSEVKVRLSYVFGGFGK